MTTKRQRIPASDDADERGRNVLFRLRPEVERKLDFVVGAGGFKTRVAALTAIIDREATKLHKNDRLAFFGRVAERADSYPPNPSAGGARMDRGERVLQAYLRELAGGSLRENRDVAVWSYSVDKTGTRIEADDAAISYLGSQAVSDICETLDILGVREALESSSRRYVALVGAGSGWGVEVRSRRPASFRC